MLGAGDQFRCRALSSPAHRAGSAPNPVVSASEFADSASKFVASVSKFPVSGSK